MRAYFKACAYKDCDMSLILLAMVVKLNVLSFFLKAEIMCHNRYFTIDGATRSLKKSKDADIY